MSDAWRYCDNLSDPEAVKKTGASGNDCPCNHHSCADQSQRRGVCNGVRLGRGTA